MVVLPTDCSESVKKELVCKANVIGLQIRVFEKFGLLYRHIVVNIVCAILLGVSDFVFSSEG